MSSPKKTETNSPKKKSVATELEELNNNNNHAHSEEVNGKNIEDDDDEMAEDEYEVGERSLQNLKSRLNSRFLFL